MKDNHIRIIADLITDDPDLFESTTTANVAFPVGFNQPSKKKRKKKYKVNPITGQPTKGEILYSDLKTNIVENAEDKKKVEAINNNLRNISNSLKNGIELPQTWNQGHISNKDFINTLETLNIKDQPESGIRRIHNLFNNIGSMSTTRSDTDDNQFISEFLAFAKDVKKWSSILKGEGIGTLPFGFPPKNWWGRNWAMPTARRGYVAILLSELSNRFIKEINIKKAEHAPTCTENQCSKYEHALFVYQLLKNGNVKLFDIFEELKGERQKAFEEFKKKPKIEKQKQKKEKLQKPEKTVGFAKPGPLETKIYQLEKAMADRMPGYSTGEKIKNLWTLGIPYVPMLIKDVENREFYDHYIARAKNAFGNEFVRNIVGE